MQLIIVLFIIFILYYIITYVFLYYIMFLNLFFSQKESKESEEHEYVMDEEIEFVQTLQMKGTLEKKVK